MIMERWVMVTAFGRPVVPEVWLTVEEFGVSITSLGWNEECEVARILSRE